MYGYSKLSYQVIIIHNYDSSMKQYLIACSKMLGSELELPKRGIYLPLP